MNQFLKKKVHLISFLFVPIFFLWHPTWIGLLGVQPYWPLFWLLPWSIIYGPTNGLIAGLFLGLILDSISPNDFFTQIPGLILCGIWFGKIKQYTDNVFVGHFRYGLICSLGSLMCGSLYFLQIMIKNLPENNFFFFQANIKNILIQVFLTGFFSPLICSQLFRIFKSTKQKSTNKFEN